MPAKNQYEASVAVIDIGSNSVRLVIYDGHKRVPMPIFNEKALCGLAKDMDQTGNLSIEGVKMAEKALSRFIKLLRQVGVKETHIFATSAVRDSKDGKAFVQRISEKHNIKVKIFSGEEESVYAGYGVISSLDTAKGIVGDLGGGSLELINVEKGKVGKGFSCPIGPLRLIREDADKNYYKDIIDNSLQDSPITKVTNKSDLYLVGGAFRSLAKVHMERVNYPLKVIHNYKVPVGDFESTLKVVIRMSDKALTKMSDISKKRTTFLPYAALVASRMIKFAKPKNIVFSVNGIREGFLYSRLPDEELKKDPLIAGCEDMALKLVKGYDYGYELINWIEPLFRKSSKNEKRLISAACILSEISLYENTEYRAELAYRKILDSSLPAILHEERVFIAKSLYCRYRPTPDIDIVESMHSVLGEQELLKAQILGAAMRLARAITASFPGLLDKTLLELTKNKIILNINKEDADLITETLEKRLNKLASIMNIESVIKVKKNILSFLNLGQS